MKTEYPIIVKPSSALTIAKCVKRENGVRISCSPELVFFKEKRLAMKSDFYLIFIGNADRFLGELKEKGIIENKKKYSYRGSLDDDYFWDMAADTDEYEFVTGVEGIANLENVMHEGVFKSSIAKIARKHGIIRKSNVTTTTFTDTPKPRLMLFSNGKVRNCTYVYSQLQDIATKFGEHFGVSLEDNIVDKMFPFLEQKRKDWSAIAYQGANTDKLPTMAKAEALHIIGKIGQDLYHKNHKHVLKKLFGESGKNANKAFGLVLNSPGYERFVCWYYRKYKRVPERFHSAFVRHYRKVYKILGDNLFGKCVNSDRHDGSWATATDLLFMCMHFPEKEIKNLPVFHSIKEAHDYLMVYRDEANIAHLKKMKDDEKYHKLFRDPENFPGFEIKLPGDGMEVYMWGVEMHHCIAAYAGEHFKGECTLLKIVHKESGLLFHAKFVPGNANHYFDGKKIIVTFGVTIEQAHGKFNSAIPDNVRRELDNCLLKLRSAE